MNVPFRMIRFRCEIANSLPTCCTSGGFVDNRRFMAWLLDGEVLLAYFITLIGIGLYKGRGDKTMEGFAVGNRSIPWWTCSGRPRSRFSWMTCSKNTIQG